ncbi:alanine racemase [Nonomuraea jiangxiensis]|uniref:Diaminopimelate decarboxylase n=1 Tax=Nonomuraea jiangxiensis TaxID=633440 RepID=A0A1G9BG90_9ACTN|nr:alanine racemase [Nonomuraea jiangxiensis]SDK37875.1 diaminopimelate decarboxylase [Nonomuraea jiangxiensis]
MLLQAKALRLAAAGALPAYLYDLDGLRRHAGTVRRAMDGTAQVLYAVKANPDERILRALSRHVDGFEVASGGELAHLRRILPHAWTAFSGPGKTDAELALALELGVARLHVESPGELTRLARIAAARPVDILLRANLRPPSSGEAGADIVTPFGMDEHALAACLPILRAAPRIRPRGVHVHLSWGSPAPAMAGLAAHVTTWALSWLDRHLPELGRPEIDLGGGMLVDYARPDHLFDWPAYGAAVAGLRVPALLRIEPGRALTAYHGWYITDVLDVKTNHGRRFAVLRGGTQHLRTPVARGHDQPFTVIGRTGGAAGPGEPVTLVGQLCTPRDVFARDVPVSLSPGDLIAFRLAGAYAWNLSHHEFLMHPEPTFHYLDREGVP